jgi:hypothetical protein
MMDAFPLSLLDELRSVFSTVPEVVHREISQPSDRLGVPSLESIQFRDASDRKFIDVDLQYQGGKRLMVTLSAEDFSDPIEKIPGRPRLSQLAYCISILATEWLFSREHEEGFPSHLYLRPYNPKQVTSVQVSLSSQMLGEGVRSIRAAVLLDGAQVGLLTEDRQWGEFVITPRDYRLQVIIDERLSSNEMVSTRLGKRVFACRVEGDHTTPSVVLSRSHVGQIIRSGYPHFFSISSEEERAEISRREPLRAEATVALRDAAGALSEASIDEDLRTRGWCRELADALAKECERLRRILEGTGWQLPRRLGDLGIERWLRAYVPSAADSSDRLQDAVLRASGALKALTAAGDE